MAGNEDLSRQKPAANGKQLKLLQLAGLDHQSLGIRRTRNESYNGPILEQKERDNLPSQPFTRGFFLHSRTLWCLFIETRGKVKFHSVVKLISCAQRVIESVLERLIDWATSALETSSNQPILPYAIVVLNASPHDIDSNLWDNDNATKTLFESLSKTVNQNDTFARYCEFWKRRGRQIDTVEQLMLCYYSSVRVSGSLPDFWQKSDMLSRSFVYQWTRNLTLSTNKHRNYTKKLNRGPRLQETGRLSCACCLMLRGYRVISNMHLITMHELWTFLLISFRYLSCTTLFHRTSAAVS